MGTGNPRKATVAEHVAGSVGSERRGWVNTSRRGRHARFTTGDRFVVLWSLNQPVQTLSKTGVEYTFLGCR